MTGLMRVSIVVISHVTLSNLRGFSVGLTSAARHGATVTIRHCHYESLGSSEVRPFPAERLLDARLLTVHKAILSASERKPHDSNTSLII